MAPEQAMGGSRSAGPAAYVWALGVILYECLTGVRSLDAADAWAVLHRVQADEPTPGREPVGAAGPGAGLPEVPGQGAARPVPDGQGTGRRPEPGGPRRAGRGAGGGDPAAVDTGFAVRCNNDHGVSPDGTRLVISDQFQGDRKSRIYTLPLAGGTPTLVTPNAPSYWHGWSPDGKTLAYCGERGGEFDVYTIPVGGGPETRLTTAEGLDGGPEYSPDGRHIYFNSERTGRMQVWRMNADGSGQEPVTDDEFNNWFPHPSPDGMSLVFVSYEKGVTGHPADKDVTQRRLTLADKKVDVLGRFLGGQGTGHVPCWSPDGRRIAFVTYQLIP